MVDLTPFSAGIDQARLELAKYGENMDAREGFRAELLAAGFTPPQIFDLGKITRIKAPGDKGAKKSGWCILYEIPMQGLEGKAIGIGIYGNWKGQPERVTWTSKSASVMSAIEAAQYQTAIEAAKQQREAELKLVQAEAAERAFGIWKDAAPADIHHAYLARKNIVGDALRQSRESLVIPVCLGDNLTSVQFIRPDGEKRFLTGGRTKGCYFRFEGRTDLVIICEGYATGSSIHAAIGGTVFCAFMASNLYEVASYAKAQYPGARIVIAGDDDKQSEDNTGRKKAEQAADGLGIESIFPACNGTDFNDLHCESGIAAVTQAFTQSAKPYESKEIDGKYPDAPMGFLGQIVDYYNATSGNYQPLFAIQTALGLSSVITGRNFATNYDNFSALYLLNVGKSATGKDHVRTVINKVVTAAQQAKILSGEGHTSAGAVISALISAPRHIVIMDEFSKHLQAAKKVGNSHYAEANSQLMKAITSCHDMLRGKVYSQMAIPKDKRTNEPEYICNPSLTMIALCPPDELFSTLDIGAIKDGFLNRFIICVSDAQRELREHREPIDVPESVLDWILRINTRRGPGAEIAKEKALVNRLVFTNEAMALHQTFAQWCLDQQNKLEKNGMSELHGRYAEMAMRIALIHALSRDTDATKIDEKDAAWAISWVRYNAEKITIKLKGTLSSSEFEGWKMESLAIIRAAGAPGITARAMHKLKPFSTYREKDRVEILKALEEAGLIAKESRATGSRGRPGMVYFAIDEED